MDNFKIVISRFLWVLFGLLFGAMLTYCYPDWFSSTKFKISTFLKKTTAPKKLWNDGFQVVKIPSSLDENVQNAFFYTTRSSKPKPLLVSLHTWGGDYEQYDSLALLSKKHDINYIHPNFRGPNKTPNSCLSKKVIQDIDDAVDFALENGNIDTTKIHIIGKSGGGYAALGSYMKSKHNLKSVSAWVPITNLIDWYSEGVIRQNKYVNDILACTYSEKGVLNTEEAMARSPLYWPTPITKRTKTKLMLYAGVYDGINGSVPITHSIDFYNKILSDFNCNDSLNYVSSKETLNLIRTRNSVEKLGTMANRKIILSKQYANTKLTIFEGGHEMLTQFAFLKLLTM